MIDIIYISAVSFLTFLVLMFINVIKMNTEEVKNIKSYTCYCMNCKEDRILVDTVHYICPKCGSIVMSCRHCKLFDTCPDECPFERNE